MLIQAIEVLKQWFLCEQCLGKVLIHVLTPLYAAVNTLFKQSGRAGGLHKKGRFV